MNNTSAHRFKTIFISSVLMFMFLQTHAQSRISVKSPDSLAFTLSISETAINQWPCISTSFDFPQSGKVNVTMSFPNHKELNFSQTINLKKNYAHFYEVEKSKGAFKLVLRSESLLERAVVAVSGEALQVGMNIQNDSTELIRVDSTTTGSAGCGTPVAVSVYENMLVEVKESYFETRKLETMKNFISGNCVSVEQLRYMMSRLSMEDNKILLVRHSKGHISDVHNIRKVEEDFFLQKNKALVSEITQSFRQTEKSEN